MVIQLLEARIRTIPSPRGDVVLGLEDARTGIQIVTSLESEAANALADALRQHASGLRIVGPEAMPREERERP